MSDWVQNVYLQVDTSQILTLIRLGLLMVVFSGGGGEAQSDVISFFVTRKCKKNPKK